MNTKSLLSASLGVSTIGGVATGTYFLWPDSKSESIKASEPLSANNNGNIESKLQENQYEILDSGASEWAQIVSSYKTVVSKRQNLKFVDFDGSEPSDTTTQPRKTAANILSEKCQEILKTNKDEDYEKAEKWCIKPQSVFDRLKKLSSNPLVTTEDDKSQDLKWEEKLNKHKEANENQIESLKVSGFDAKQKEEKIKAIKVECAKLNAKKTYEEDYEVALEKSKLWCAI
ncbi:hypothetical protein A6V39_00030 [Candidatus Mycoplasma haematobovis]|uniref:Uncharacterized protein n=1 Tax=Candidatus Mycoplasma haematobovis TaxID=432608 RepID=A0A1A9QEQ7_9MOLU|nr:hypothetical protein [Candidatus Mycoplasma haematobovis]OAL10436.1 hypothetical protein A6V39_00030 [Candidatus Mycoplasma haematobovis]